MIRTRPWSRSRRAYFTAGFLVLAGLGIGGLVPSSTSGGPAQSRTEGPGPGASSPAETSNPAAPATVVRAPLSAGEGETVLAEAAKTAPVADALRNPGRIAPAPPESAVVRQVDPSSIPPEVMARLWARRAEAEKKTGPARPLPPVDPDAKPRGIVRPLGSDRLIQGAQPDEVPPDAASRLRTRIESASPR